MSRVSFKRKLVTSLRGLTRIKHDCNRLIFNESCLNRGPAFRVSRLSSRKQFLSPSAHCRRGRLRSSQYGLRLKRRQLGSRLSTFGACKPGTSPDSRLPRHAPRVPHHSPSTIFRTSPFLIGFVQIKILLFPSYCIRIREQLRISVRNT